MTTNREWFTSFYSGQKSHADIEAQVNYKDIVALVDFNDWKENRMPVNPDFGTRNRKSFSEMTKDITDVALQGIKKQRDNLEDECKLAHSKLDSLQTAYSEICQQNLLLKNRNEILSSRVTQLEQQIAHLKNFVNGL